MQIGCTWNRQSSAVIIVRRTGEEFVSHCAVGFSNCFTKRAAPHVAVPCTK
jgi:hypothetical protein